ncbi:hypothetical protein P22_0390 [Propionispora sp. 2/2-37]|uniref:flavoprotein n=1 Tax=Propionispora sp. 2/2-37 TaxID=1677858 RepID=UPI0006BB92C4|nr:flavoprotein [Propionispora sp. 2/2-37]CUH94324.1 hypothetical protein P22_0390 [Propionispora sp. 2/2-37]
MEREHIIERVTREVMNRLRSRDSGNGQKKVLALFTGGSIGMETGLEEVNRLQALGAAVTVVLSPAAEKIIGRETVQAALGSDIPIVTVQDRYPGKEVREAAVLVVPVLTQNTAAKVANTLADSLASTMIMQRLMTGKPVIAAYNAADPRDASRCKLQMGQPAPALMQALQANLKKLESYGVVLVPVEGLANACQTIWGTRPQECFLAAKSKKTVIDAPAVKAAFHSGCRQIMIPAAAIITPLARDLARDYGLELVRK